MLGFYALASSPASSDGGSSTIPQTPNSGNNGTPQVIDLTKIPVYRKVIFSGGTRVVQFAGNKRTVRF